MFDKAHIKAGEDGWELRKGELLAENPNITVADLMDAEAEYWAEFYDDDLGDGVDEEAEGSF
jgi:hypothetical protein